MENKGKFTGWGVSLDHKLFNVRSYPVYGTLGYRGAYYDDTTEKIMPPSMSSRPASRFCSVPTL